MSGMVPDKPKGQKCVTYVSGHIQGDPRYTRQYLVELICYIVLIILLLPTLIFFLYSLLLSDAYITGGILAILAAIFTVTLKNYRDCKQGLANDINETTLR